MITAYNSVNRKLFELNSKYKRRILKYMWRVWKFK